MGEAVDLGAECEAAVERLVETGRFSSRDAVLSEGVELLLKRETARRELESSVEASLRDEADGALMDADEAFDGMDARIKAAFHERAVAA